MSRSLENQHYPLPVYSFRVFLAEKAKPVSDQGKNAKALGTEFMGFSSVEGLSQERDSVRYYHGLSWRTGAITQLGMHKPLTITLKRGLAPKRNQLTKWFQEGGEARDLEVHLLDPAHNPSVVWKVYKALPTKLDGPGFTANSNEIAVEQISLTAESLRVIFL